MTAARADARAPAVAPSEHPPPRRHLAVVEEQAAARRRVRWGALSLLVLFLAVFGVVVFQALLVQAQGRLDDAERAITAEEARAKRLRLDLAGAESPERIAEAARTRLGMIVPTEQVYLQPEPTDEARAAFDPATQPAPSPTTTAPKAPGTGAGTAPKAAATGGTVPNSGAATSPTTTRAKVPTAPTKATAPATTKATAPSGAATPPTTAKAAAPTAARGAAR